MDSGRYTQFMCNSSVCQELSLREGVSNASWQIYQIWIFMPVIRAYKAAKWDQITITCFMEKGIQFHVIMSTYSKCYFQWYRCMQYQWWRDLFRCRIDLLNFSMGFNIVAPCMVCVTQLHINGSLHHWYFKVFDSRHIDEANKGLNIYHEIYIYLATI